MFFSLTAYRRTRSKVMNNITLLAAVIVLGLGALFLLFVLLFSQRVASHPCETFRERLHHPSFLATGKQITFQTPRGKKIDDRVNNYHRESP